MEDALPEIAKKDVIGVEDAYAALQALSADDLKKLALYARKFAAYTRSSAAELVNEAVLRTLNGDRKCPRDLPMMTFLAQTIRSVANGEYKDPGRKATLELVPSHGKMETPFEPVDERVAADENLIEKQTVNAVLALFDDDPLAQSVAEGIMIGMEGQELCELAEIDATALAAVRKKIGRRIASAYPKGWRHG